MTSKPAHLISGSILVLCATLLWAGKWIGEELDNGVGWHAASWALLVPAAFLAVFGGYLLFVGMGTTAE